jgi:hypothetical protein
MFWLQWNGSTEQARAIAFAMPILKRARRVIVLTVEGGAAVPGPKGEQVCRYLQFNDVPARPLTVSLDGRLTGEAILAHDERNDDLKSNIQVSVLADL